MVSVLKRLGLDPKTLERLSAEIPAGLDASTGQKLLRALARPEIKLVYARQWIDKMFRIIKKKIASMPSVFIADDEHVNSLAEAMSAWRTSTQIKKHIPSSLVRMYYVYYASAQQDYAFPPKNFHVKRVREPLGSIH